MGPGPQGSGCERRVWEPKAGCAGELRCRAHSLCLSPLPRSEMKRWMISLAPNRRTKFVSFTSRLVGKRHSIRNRSSSPLPQGTLCCPDLSPAPGLGPLPKQNPLPELPLHFPINTHLCMGPTLTVLPSHLGCSQVAPWWCTQPPSPQQCFPSPCGWGTPWLPRGFFAAQIDHLQSPWCYTQLSRIVLQPALSQSIPHSRPVPWQTARRSSVSTPTWPRSQMSCP